MWVRFAAQIGPPRVLLHEGQIGPGDVVRPPKRGAQQLAGHQQVRYEVRPAPGPTPAKQAQAFLGLLHDPQGAGHRLVEGRGQGVGVALGPGPGELKISLDILGLQPPEPRGHQSHLRQEITPERFGLSHRGAASLLQLDHFLEQSQAQGGAVGRGGATAWIRPGLGQGFQESRVHVPPSVKLGARSACHGKFSRYLLLWAEVGTGSTIL